MSRPRAWWSAVSSVLRRGGGEPPYLSDDLSDDEGEAAVAGGEDELPRFNKLRVLVAGDEEPGGNRDTAANGRHPPSGSSDDESLLDRDNSQPRAKAEPCEKCSQEKERSKQGRVKRRLCLAGGLYLLFMLGELVGGYVANSLAIMTDALHMLTDLSSIVLTLLALWLSEKSPNKHFTFGFHRLANSPRANQGHSHGSLAVRAAFVHALGDLAQSVGVLIAAYIIRFKPQYKIADPICTYIFSVLVIFTTLRIMRDTILIILEGVPKHLNVDQIKDDLMKIDDVYSIEDLNIWSLTTGKSTAIIRVQLSPGCSSKWEEVQAKARHILLNTYGMYKCFIQIQSYRQEENKTCANCASA
ncbi:hypothetical protein FKM82_004755 [Ascaphus truei]